MGWMTLKHSAKILIQTDCANHTVVHSEDLRSDSLAHSHWRSQQRILNQTVWQCTAVRPTHVLTLIKQSHLYRLIHSHRHSPQSFSAKHSAPLMVSGTIQGQTDRFLRAGILWTIWFQRRFTNASAAEEHCPNFETNRNMAWCLRNCFVFDRIRFQVDWPMRNCSSYLTTRWDMQWWFAASSNTIVMRFCQSSATTTTKFELPLVSHSEGLETLWGFTKIMFRWDWSRNHIVWQSRWKMHHAEIKQ